MKNNIITSAITIMCVLCGGWISGAFAAPSVRALGGAGTYTGTTSAAAARTGGTTATTSARAGSVRVTPSVKVSTSTTPRVSNSGTSVSTSDDQRMSIGKYLGPSVTGAVKVSDPGATAEEISGITADLDNVAGRVTALEGTVESMDSDLSTLNEQIETFLTKGAADSLYQPIGNYVKVADFGTMTGEYLTDKGYLTNAGLTELNTDIAKLGTRVGNVESAIDTLNGDENTQNSVKSISAEMAAGALATARTYTDTLANGAVATNTAAIAAINNTSTGVLKQAKDYTDEAVAAATGGTTLPTGKLSNGQYYVWDTTGTAPQWRVISIEDTWSDGIPSGT